MVSVAVITFNQQEFIQETIESIINQDYQNFEIVISDDCSQDETWKILQAYHLKFPEKIKINRNERNLGITGNCNEILKQCKGKYIAWMGGDDLMMPGKLSTQVSYMETHPSCAICYHDLDVFEHKTGKTLYKFSKKNIPRQGSRAILIKYGCFNGGCSTMTRRGSSPLDGFDTRLPIASDWLYWIECLDSNTEIHYIDKILGRYRRHGGNITGNSGRQVNFRALTDHFLTCAILKYKYPEHSRAILSRESALYRGFRFNSGGEKFNNYLTASLLLEFNFKSFIGLLVSYLFKIRL
jgi:glycosyltransferase involved in cell wall biosynthesis